MKNKIFYQLDYNDIQTVALDEIERKLTLKEIESIVDLISENIKWYDIISRAIADLEIDS